MRNYTTQMDGLQYAQISYITAFPQKTDKRMSCYDRYSSRIRQCDPLVSCIIKHTTKAVCFIMVEARGVALACGLGPVADLTCHWHVIQHRSHVRLPKSLISCIIKHTAKAVCFIMVEARGVEPLSENRFTELSTSVCYPLKFPLEHPITGAHPWVAFLCVTASKANRQCTCITK